MTTVMPPYPDMNGTQNEHDYCGNSDGVMFFAQAALLYLTMGVPATLPISFMGY